jgi:hypothetical protein
MGLVVYGPLVQEVSGTVGGVTFARVQCGKDARGWRAPCNKRRPDQLERRSLLSRFSGKWLSELSVAEREDWDIYAATCVFKNSLGLEYHIKGFNFFLRNMLMRYNFQPYPQLTAPTDTGFGQSYSFTWALNHTTGLLTITASDPVISSNTAISVELHALRPITRVFPIPLPIATSEVSTAGGYPVAVYLYTPIPITSYAQRRALVRYYTFDVSARITQWQWALADIT